MAKTTENAKSRVTKSKKSIIQHIEEFTGIHSCSDVVALPLEGTPVCVELETSNNKVVKVKTNVPPITTISSEGKDDIQEGIDNIISGNSRKHP